MKRGKIFLALFVILTIMPAIAIAEDLAIDATATATDAAVLDTYNDTNNDTNNCDICSYTTDIKAYGDQTASHSVGVMTVDSTDITHTDFENFSFDGTIDTLNGSPCTDGDCDFSVMQGDYEISTETGYSNVTTNVDVTSYTANVDMSSYGGLAVCTSIPAAATGTFDQYQEIGQVVYGPNGSYSTYTGYQDLSLSTNP